MDSGFMQAMAEGLADYGIRVVRFEFPHMINCRETGTQRPPDRKPILSEAWLEMIKSREADKLIIGGIPMGGRIASLIADETEVPGLVCLS